MDPSFKLCERRFSFDTVEPEISLQDLPKTFKRNEIVFIEPTFPEKRGIYLANEERMIPIGKSIFNHYDSIIIANIDALYKFTGHVTGILNPIVSDAGDEFLFVDIDSPTDGFTQYLQWRRPASTGIGIKEKNNWNMERIDTDRFEVFESGGRSLKETWLPLINTVKRIGGMGVDLVIGNYKYLAEEILITLRTLKNGGNAVLKIGDIFPDLIYIFSGNFEEIILFRPASSSDLYLVGWKFNLNEPLVKILEQAVDIGFNSIFDSLPDNFEFWLEEQLNIRTPIVNQSDYNLDKFLIIWNLPGNI